MKKNIFVLLLVFIMSVLNASSQGRGAQDRMMFLDYGDRFFAEAFVVPTSQPDSATVTILFRMANDFLTFVRNDDRSDNGGEYVANMQVSIEVRDSMGVIRQRIPWKSNAYTNTFEETNSKTEFHYGWATLRVGPGTYTIAIELLAKKESQQRQLRLPPVTFRSGRSKSPIATPVFGEPQKSGALRPYVFGGNLAFGPRDASAWIIVDDTSETMYDYRLRQLPYDIRDIRWWAVSDVVGEERVQPRQNITLSSRSTNDIPLLESSSVGQGGVGLLNIDIPTTGLVPGRYQLDLVRRGSTDTIAVKFHVMWELMPLSLRTIEYAIEILQYVTTEDELDVIDDGSDPERREKLMAWWKKQDPTPTTTWNERMSEYYRRVDQAFFAFSTIQEPDGARSDRGKIYILHGPPTTTSKKMTTSDRPVEVWTYANKVGKTFTFETNDRGIVELMDIK
ncbi:MAG TPA: hypothetical protein DIS79_05560 [Bacteroidetes bacterium]|nr:hypothetical protein [Bacteroidota bacterium]HRK03805.1 GWxTD domain-containing protein [Chlorobiota bacterium]